MPKSKRTIDLGLHNVELISMAIAVCDELDPKRAWDAMDKNLRVISRAHAIRFLSALRGSKGKGT